MQYIPFADTVIVMKDGLIDSVGSYSELLHTSESLKLMLRDFGAIEEKKKGEEEAEEEKKPKKERKGPTSGFSFSAGGPKTAGKMKLSLLFYLTFV